MRKGDVPLLLDKYLKALKEFFQDYSAGKIPSDVKYQDVLISNILQGCIKCVENFKIRSSCVVGPEKVFVILPGNVPVVIFQIFPILLIRGVREVFFKFPLRERSFPGSFLSYVTRNLKNEMEVGGAYLTHEESFRKITGYDFVIAFGGGEFQRALTEVSKPYRFFGPKFSFGVLWNQPDGVTLEKIAFDVLSFDTRGCLSMRYLFTSQKLDEELLLHAFSKVSKLLPPESDFDIEIAEYEVLKNSLDAVRILKGRDFFILLSNRLIEISSLRTLVIVNIDNAEELDSLISPYRNNIQGIASDGYYPEFTSASHIAVFGNLQFPPCGWYFEKGVTLDNFLEV